MSAQFAPSDTRPNRSMPPGTLIPELVYPDRSAAVAWLCTTFGFAERLRIGNHRSQIRIGESAAMVVVQATAPAAQDPTSGLEQSPPSQPTHSLMVRVADVDRHYEHVLECGARLIAPPADFPYGERQYTVEDLAGHRWTFSQSIADVDPQAWGGVLLDSGGGPA